MNKSWITISVLLALAAYECAGDSKSQNSIRSYYKKLERKNETLSSTCNECKFVVSELKTVLDDPAKLDEIKAALKALCDILGGSEAEQCKDIVENLDVLIHKFKPFLDDPEQFCKELHLCAQNKLHLLNQLVLLQMKMLVRHLKKTRTGSDDFLCDECVFAVNELNNMVQSPEVQQQLKQQLEDLCGIFSRIEKPCDSLVEEYFPQLVQALENLLKDPKQLCVVMSFCQSFTVPSMKLFKSTSSHVVLLNRMPESRRVSSALRTFSFLSPRIQTTNGNNAMCLMCEVGLESIINKMKQNSEVIARKTSAVTCNMLPSDARSSCFDFTRIYASSLVKMVVSEWSPEEICTAFHVCTNESVAEINAITPSQRSEAACDACHTFAEFINYEFKQPSLQQEIVALVKEKVCRVLPGDLANQCLDMADQIVPMIMQQISDYVGREAFCRDLGMC